MFSPFYLKLKLLKIDYLNEMVWGLNHSAPVISIEHTVVSQYVLWFSHDMRKPHKH